MTSPTVPRTPDEPARLLLGPMLRHVTPTSATVWVEVSAPSEVRLCGDGLDAVARTFSVAGHHYALVIARDLAPGSSITYEVLLDRRPVWPEPGSALPPSVLHTPDVEGPVTLAFGSCRYASPPALTGPDGSGSGDGRGAWIGPDALDALAQRIIADPAQRPDLLLLLGDQVYADEVTAGTRARIAERRGDREPRREVADYEEYTWLYHESWSDPEVRWLFSTVPTAMVFDDHDVHDDWNTSASWREDAATTSWWSERILAGLASAWVYQHLGNLSPDDLDAEPVHRSLLEQEPGADAEPILRMLALAADTEKDGAKGYRWSYSRDLGRTRVVVVDSRCGRVFGDGGRGMIGDQDFEWLADVCGGDYDHLVLATSLPWLLAPALHDLEAWNERLAASPGRRRAALGEKIRRAVDLEHWAAFGASFDKLSELLRKLAFGELGRPSPRSVTVLSGDVHHSYLARVRWAPGPGVGAATPVHQVTCSPLHQAVPPPMRWMFKATWSRPVEGLVALVHRVRRSPASRRPGFTWHRVGGGPWLGNAVGTLVLDGPHAVAVLATSERPKGATGGEDGEPLRELVRLPLTGQAAPRP